MNWIYTINFYLEKIGTLNNTRSEENLVVPHIFVLDFFKEKNPQNIIYENFQTIIHSDKTHLEYEYFRIVNIKKKQFSNINSQLR